MIQSQPASQPSPRVAQPSAVREENGERANPDTGEIPVIQKRDGHVTDDPNDPDVAKAIHHERQTQRKETRKRGRRNRLIAILIVIAALALATGGAFGAYRWSQTKYFIGNADGVVAVYQGVNTNVFGLALSHEVKRTNIDIDSLPQAWRDQLQDGITFNSYDEAIQHVQVIRQEKSNFNDNSNTSKSSGDAGNGTSDSSDSSDSSGSNGTDGDSSAGSSQTDGGTADGTAGDTGTDASSTGTDGGDAQ